MRPILALVACALVADALPADGGEAMSAATPCRMHVVDAGFPHRTAALLARETQSFPSMVSGLISSGRGAEPPAEAPTVDALVRGLESDEPIRPYVAAFLIGRCKADDADADEALTDALTDAVERLPPGAVAIEAAMSLALRGRAALGRAILLEQLRAPGVLSHQYKAAFYLAELGDPSGYDVVVATLRGEVAHYRLMALRHVLAFESYAGQRIGDLVIDVRSLLVERLTDPEVLVRSEVPFYLEELQVPDLRELLTPVERDDASPTVRTAARIVIERN